MALKKVMPGRSLEAIKGQRRNASHNNLVKSLLDQTQTDHEYPQAGHIQIDGRITAEEEVQESQHQDAVEDTESMDEENP